MFKKLKAQLFEIIKDPLHQNSLFLIMSTGIMAAVGFFFWIFVAKIYSPQSIGLASSLISMTALLVLVSTLGLPTTLIRFLPKSNDPQLQSNTALLLTVITAVLSSSAFWILSKLFFTDLHRLIDSPITFLLFTLSVIVGCWQLIIDSMFIASKRTYWILLESLITSLSKLLIVLMLGSLLGFGIYISNSIGLFLAVLVNLIVQIKLYKFKLSLKIDTSILKRIAKYSASSYFVNLTGMLPSQLLPALITTSLGAASAGHFFLALMMINLLTIVPQASGQTLLSAGSTEPKALKKLTINSVKFQTLLVLLGISFFWIFGGWILSWFGKGYVEEMVPILRILSLGVLPMIVSAPLITRLRVRKELSILNLISLLSSITVLISSWVGSSQGLIGLASGFVVGQLLSTSFIFLHFQITSRHRLTPFHFNENRENI